MHLDSALDAQQIVNAYASVLERQFLTDATPPYSRSLLPSPKDIIKKSIATTVTALTHVNAMTDELREFLEIAYTSLADYVDDELVRAVTEYREAMAAVAREPAFGREKTHSAPWQRLSDMGPLIADIAKNIAEESQRLGAEFRDLCQPALAPPH